MDAGCRRHGPVLSRMGDVGGTVGIDTPFVWHGGSAIDGILVEGEELLVEQDGQHVVTDGGERRADDQRALQCRPQREVASTLLHIQPAADL